MSVVLAQLIVVAMTPMGHKIEFLDYNLHAGSTWTCRSLLSVPYKEGKRTQWVLFRQQVQTHSFSIHLFYPFCTSTPSRLTDSQVLFGTQLLYSLTFIRLQQMPSDLNTLLFRCIYVKVKVSFVVDFHTCTTHTNKSKRRFLLFNGERDKVHRHNR